MLSWSAKTSGHEDSWANATIFEGKPHNNAYPNPASRYSYCVSTGRPILQDDLHCLHQLFRPRPHWNRFHWLGENSRILPALDHDGSWRRDEIAFRSRWGSSRDHPVPFTWTGESNIRKCRYVGLSFGQGGEIPAIEHTSLHGWHFHEWTKPCDEQGFAYCRCNSWSAYRYVGEKALYFQ